MGGIGEGIKKSKVFNMKVICEFANKEMCHNCIHAKPHNRTYGCDNGSCGRIGKRTTCIRVKDKEFFSKEDFEL